MEPPPSTGAGQEEQELRERAFFSWAEFSRFFDAWCQQRLALFFVKSSMHLARCRWASAPPLYTLVDVLKYSYVRLVCKDVRAPSRPAVGPPQPGCPAFIIVKLSPLRDRLVVTECQLTHSHPACPLEFAYYFRPGHLLANACLPVRTTNKISKQFVAPADVRRLLSYCKGRDHGVLDALHVLEGLFRTDPEAKVKLVFVEDQAVVETVFFLTSRTRALLRRFPRMLLVDRLPGLQGALDLLAVLCVDGAGRARQAACCVARPGTPSLLRFALASLLQSAPDVKGRVRCLTAGPEVAAQLPAVRQLLPGARVQICRAQGLETLFSKAQELGGAGCEDPGLWPRLCRLAGASSPAAYAEALAELRAHGPAAFVDYFERNWAPRRDMWVRFRAFEAARDLDACALVRGHRRRLLRRLSPSRSVAQCLRDLVAMQWADAAGEAAPDVSDDRGAWLEGESGRGAQMGNERVKGPETGDWGGAPKEESVWREAQLQKEWARGLETRDRGGAAAESENGRGLQIRDWRGDQLENQKVRQLEGSAWRGSQLEKGHLRGPEIRDWRGSLLEGEKDWGPEGYIWRGAPVEDQRLRGLEGFTWRTAQLEDRRIRVLDTTDGRGPWFDYEAGSRSLDGSPWRGAWLHDKKASGLKIRDWKGLPLEVEKGRGLEVRTWRGVRVEKPLELVRENRDQKEAPWREGRPRGPEAREERGVRLGVKRRRDLEDVVLVQLGDTRVTGLENGDGGGAQSGSSQSRGGQGMECGDTGEYHLGLGNGVPGSTPVGTVLEGDPEWAVTRRLYPAAREGAQEGSGEGPREPKRPRCPSGEEEVDWEPLAKFRAACGPELAELVAEELAFARQHGTRGFHWMGAGFALKDGTSDFFLDGALTRCSCSIHAARRLPCRHLFAARLLTGAALFHMDLLRDCWGRAPEP
uniref:Zinc finger SWIM-type containing 9 n=1 Tax=Catagonus wagneri TaxID=51154 RepID=A0A8C3WX55_9CETA